MKTIGACLAAILPVIALSGCAVAENELPSYPVASIAIEANRTAIPDTGIVLIEGKSVVLDAVLFPAGVPGGVYWQSSRAGVVEMSDTQGLAITINASSGGESVIRALARNFHNDMYAEAAVTVTVIPTSFFKWNYRADGWTAIGANTNAAIRGVVVRAAGVALAGTAESGASGGFVMDGGASGGSRFIIGSGMASPTNSPFDSDPVYDLSGAFDFRGRCILFSVEYELPPLAEPASRLLRLQINNNTGAADKASAIDNWLAAELSVPADTAGRMRGTLSGVFDGTISRVVKPGVAGNDADEKRDNVLSSSFAAISLSGGKAIIRAVKIENAEPEVWQ